MYARFGLVAATQSWASWHSHSWLCAWGFYVAPVYPDLSRPSREPRRACPDLSRPVLRNEGASRGPRRASRRPSAFAFSGGGSKAVILSELRERRISPEKINPPRATEFPAAF